MWSVWSESIDIHLGQGLAMLATKRQGEKVLHFSPTMPLERVLIQLGLEMAQLSNTKGPFRRRLTVTLSGALCPGFAFNVPKVVKRWHERQSIAQASIASVLGVPVEQVVCETDGYQSGIAASVNRHLFDTIKRWSDEQSCDLVSVQPLWSIASQCRLANPKSVKGLLVQEPDSITLVTQSDTGEPAAATLLCSRGVPGESENVRRWLVGVGLNQSQLLSLLFEVDKHSVLHGRPDFWSTHWSVEAEVV